MGEGNFSDGSPPRDAATIPEQHLADECQTVSTLLPDKPSDEPTILRANVEPPSAQPERTLPKVDGYEILGRAGPRRHGRRLQGPRSPPEPPCVLKMILAGAHADAEAVVRFLAEAEAVARLQHPNIVQIHHIGEPDGLPFFELEYVDGGSLAGGSTARLAGQAGGRARRGRLRGRLPRRTGRASSTATSSRPTSC